MPSSDQIETFHRQGFVALAAAIPKPELAPLREAAAAIVADFDIDAHRTVFSTLDRDRGRDDYFMDSAQAVHCFLEEEALDAAGQLRVPADRAINKIGHALHDRVPAFREFCRRPLFGQALRALGQIDPVIWQTMYIFKQPKIGGEVRWHQDASYLITKPASVIGIWVALEDASLQNGCLLMQPGGHRSPLREIYEVDPGTRRGALRTLDDAPWPGEDAAVALELPAGSVVLFHDHMPHRSSPNRSPSSRHAFTLHAAPERADWLASNWLQRPDLNRFRI